MAHPVPAVMFMSTVLTKVAVPIGRECLTACVLDSDKNIVQSLVETIENMGYQVFGTADVEEALEQVRAGRCRVVIYDMEMAAMNGLTFLAEALKMDPGVHIILSTSCNSIEIAIEAIKHGAYDCVSKPFENARLKRTLDQLSEMYDQRRRIRHLEEQLLPDLEFHGIVGKSPAMLEVFDQARKVARHYSNVLLMGPTGVGKELVAHAIHQLSPVSQHRLAICNCSALVDTLLESQLFGHIRGAFTGATDTRPGLFEYANGGTVFLDEVAEMSIAMQAKLLRVIQNREIQRVGSPETRCVDVRLIAATNRDLRAEVVAGRFRTDLFYRLNSIQIRVPSLTERLEDIPLLVQFLLKKYNHAYGKTISGLTRRTQTLLLQHNWPGNVRELENVISSACITTMNDFIDVCDLPEHLQKPGARAIAAGSDSWSPVSLDEVRRIHIQRVLQMCEGNRVHASKVLGIGRTSLYRYLKRDARGKAGATAA